MQELLFIVSVCLLPLVLSVLSSPFCFFQLQRPLLTCRICLKCTYLPFTLTLTSQLPQAHLFFGVLFPFRFTECVTVECVAFSVFSVVIHRLVTFGVRDLIGCFSFSWFLLLAVLSWGEAGDSWWSVKAAENSGLILLAL